MLDNSSHTLPMRAVFFYYLFSQYTVDMIYKADQTVSKKMSGVNSMWQALLKVMLRCHIFYVKKIPRSGDLLVVEIIRVNIVCAERLRT